MHFTLPTLTAKDLLPSFHWRKLASILAIATAFIFTLLLTLIIASAALGAPARARADAAAAATAESELKAEYTLPIDDDLASLGYKPDDDPSDDQGLPAVAEIAAPGSAPSGLAAAVPASASPTPALPAATATKAATATTVPSPTAALPNWDRKGRVNILLMGLDGNASQGRYRRADSLIVASFDPATNSAVLIGVPRDVYVTIHSPKGAIRNRINTAYVWGELYNYPGGGPALQMRTVGELLGLPIHHYVSVYFDGFAKLIDAIGGIDINVPTALRDNFTGWSFNAGMQHMDGKKALQYARSRYSTSDFSRGRRQQLVILAAVEKMTKAGILPKLPAVLPTVTEAFRSDMSIPDLLALASLGYKIDRSQIKTAQVDETMVQSWRTPEGAAVLLPRNDRIKTMVQSALTPLPAPTPTSVPSPAPATASAASGQTPTAPGTQPAPTAPAPTAAPLAADAYRSEQARVEVLNGTNRIGLARATQSSLQAKGVQVVRIADATGIYKQTVLYDDGSKPATRDYLVKLLNIKPENVRALQPGGVNLRIILGTDFKVP